MNTFPKSLLLAFLVITLASGAVWSQSILDNPDYQRARLLQFQADQAQAAGDYDRALELANEAKLYSEKAYAWAEVQASKYTANRWKRNAERRIEYIRTKGGDKTHPEIFADGLAAYALSAAAFDAEEYDDCIAYAQNALGILAGIPDPTGVMTAEEVLPKYYVVRLIPEARDCLWRIAEYPFIYNDSSQGGVIYRANRDKFTYPDNPDLIFPGQVFLIPSIAGETREGVFNPDEWEVALPEGTPEVRITAPSAPRTAEPGASAPEEK